MASEPMSDERLAEIRAELAKARKDLADCAADETGADATAKTEA